MNRFYSLFLGIAFLSITATSTGDEGPFDNPSNHGKVGNEHQWTGFRGDGTSYTDAVNLPLKWSESENIAWRADLEGFGQSGPVVWDGKVFITSINSGGDEPLWVTCLSLKSGKSLWQKSFSAGHQIKYTRMYARAAPTPVVDETGLYVFFGSGDLMKMSHQGQVLWSRSLVGEFGVFEGNHGMSTSPLRWKNNLILLIAHEGPSYVLAVDVSNGKTRWKRDREPAVAFSTPMVSSYKGRDQLIISASGVVEAMDLESGNRLWHTGKITKNAVPSPSIYGDHVIIGSSDAGSSCAVRLGGSGDITDTHMTWQGGSASSFGSPLVHGGYVYFVNRAGVISCLEAKTGTVIWKHRMGVSCWASPVAAGNRLYFFGSDGKTLVMAGNNSQPKVLAENQLHVEKEDEVYGVAVVDHKILIRTGAELTCVSHQKPDSM